MEKRLLWAAKVQNKKRKTLDKDRKVDAEGVSLYLGKGFLVLLPVSDVAAYHGDGFGRDVKE